MRIGLVMACAVLLAACGSGTGRYDGSDNHSTSADADAEASATEAAEEAKQSVYEEHGANSDGTGADASNVEANDVTDTGNYTCTQDCSGHEAGFSWAQDNDVTDPSECGGNSQSFIEGCEAFAEERQAQADREVQEAADQAAEEANYEADVE